MNNKFKTAVKAFQKLPGVGPRQAARFIMALLEKSESELYELGTTISNLKKDIRTCSQCFNISENGLCYICSDEKRKINQLLVVQKVTDLDSLEKTGLYRGQYHVLGGAINPVEGATIDNLRFRELDERIKNLSQKGSIELIVATNPDTSGETTALYIKELYGKRSDILLTRLGRGLASGSNLEYADENTLRHALESRK